MRCRLRRTVVYSLIGFCGFMFLLTLQRSSENLDEALEASDVVKDSYMAFQLNSKELLGVPREYENQIDNTDINSPLQNSKKRKSGNIWTAGNDKFNDRILEQMAHIPANYVNDTSPVKYIYVVGGLWDTPVGQKKFIEQECPVASCYLTMTKEYQTKADALLFQNSMDGYDLDKLPGQIWILWLLESPLNTLGISWLQDKINWTASYRSDSTIVTPYEKFVPFSNFTGLPSQTVRNYAQGKTKMIAWFVSNCNAWNKRSEFVRQLRKHVPVDIYGACGSFRCTRGIGAPGTNKCDNLLNIEYKFYLSFENSNCEYYITEKLFWNALLNDIVPIVMGARQSDYLAAAPPDSYIHTEDFDSAKSLAAYLMRLDRDDHLYNQYFRWKNTGSFINTKFWCRMCAMLHDDAKPNIMIDDVEKWWRNNGTCTHNRWDDEKDLIGDWKDLIVSE